MGKWGIGLCENDEMLDWLDIMNSNLHVIEEEQSWQSLEYTKSSFQNLLKYTLKNCKNPKNSVFASLFTYDIETTNKRYNGEWESKPLIYTFIVGKRLGHKFEDDYLNFVFFSCFDQMAQAAKFWDPDNAMGYLHNMGEVQKSLKKKGRDNLFHIL